MRLTVKNISDQSGLCMETVRKHADEGKIPHMRDLNGWRIFSERSIEIARKLAGTLENQKPATEQTARVSRMPK